MQDRKLVGSWTAKGYETHLDSDWAALFGDGQAEFQEVLEAVAAGLAAGALDGALQLAPKDVVNDAGVACTGVGPGLLSLLCHAPLA